MNLSQRIAQAKALLGMIHGERAFGAPVQVNLRITNRCNLRCIHCYYYSPYVEEPNYPALRAARRLGRQSPDSGYLKRMLTASADSTQLRSLAEELIGMGVRSWQLGGNGEPFMHKDALDLIGLLKHAGSSCNANTNGTLLDNTAMDELIKVRFDELRITTMAGTLEVYMRTHPGVSGDTFVKLADTLLYVAERKAAAGVRRPEITLVFIVIAQNAEDVFKFAEFAAHVKADRVLYRPVDDVKDPGLAHLVPTEKQAAYIEEQLGEAESYLISKGILHNIRVFRKIFRRKLYTEALYKTIPCHYGWLAVMIEPDGSVYPCCRCFEPLGNVYEQKFREIWNGRSYRRYRKEAVQLNVRKTPVRGCDCYSCVHHTANLRAYRVLHPLKGKPARLERFLPNAASEDV